MTDSSDQIPAPIPPQHANQGGSGNRVLSPERSRTLRRVFFVLGIVAAALVGALAGLLLVYSTDLPQIDDLERYRPSAITELFDQHGKVIGTFALQRRVIAKYEDYPKVLRDAV